VREKREAELEALARAKVAAECGALEAAHQRIQSEQAAEMLALAKIAAEQEAARVLTERLAVEQEAAVAAEARQLAETEAQVAQAERQALEQQLANTPHVDMPVIVQPEVQRPTGWSSKLTVVLVVACIAAGGLAGAWFSGKQFGFARSALPGDGALKLDTRLSQTPPLRQIQQPQPLVLPNR
jgi:hypothetical protein